MYPAVFEENKLLLVDRVEQAYFPATYIPTEYLPLIIPYAGLYYEQDNDYTTLSQHMQLGPFSLWLHDIFAHKDIVLCPYAPFHLWALHFMYEGSLRTESFTHQAFKLEEKECNLFNLYSSLHRVPMDGGNKILSFHINIQPAALMQLVQQHPGLYYLANKRVQRVSGVINERPYRINAVCDMLVKQIIGCRFLESQALHFLERCCLDIFLNFAQQDAIADEISPPDEAHTALFHRIFTYLMEHPHIPHSTSEIGRVFNISGIKLAQGFRQHFSIGIASFLHMQRMMLAYNCLIQQPSSIKEIADITGHTSADDLIRDVEKYYSCNIAALRRSM